MAASVQPKTRRRLAVLFSIPLAFSLVFFFVDQASEHRETRLLNVQRMSRCVTQLRAHARDAESGERGFYLNADERFLDPLKQANSTLASLLRQTRAYASDRKSYQPDIEKLIALVNKRFDEAWSGINNKRANTFTQGALLAHLNDEQDTMDQVRLLSRNLLDRLNREELAILDSQQKYAQWSFVFFFTGSLLMIGVIIWLYNALVRYLGERDVANAKLRSVNMDLEARIEERTRDLTQANEELQQFAYLASHDLQEPLRTVTSFSQLLAVRYQGKLDAEADEFIGYIVNSSRRMTSLINGILALVRLRKSSVPTERVSFDALVDQAEMSLQTLIRDTGASIERGPMPDLIVDPVQLSQVVQNLISNAIKYRRDEPPKIRISALRQGSEWVFSVADNGQGFDPQYAERIFGLFQRLHTQEIEGSGMGLAITRKIIERHGGKIWAESKVGEGSVFYFSLPVTPEYSRMDTPRTLEPAASRQ